MQKSKKRQDNPVHSHQSVEVNSVQWTQPGQVWSFELDPGQFDQTPSSPTHPRILPSTITGPKTVDKLKEVNLLGSLKTAKLAPQAPQHRKTPDQKTPEQKTPGGGGVQPGELALGFFEKPQEGGVGSAEP